MCHKLAYGTHYCTCRHKVDSRLQVHQCDKARAFGSALCKPSQQLDIYDYSHERIPGICPQCEADALVRTTERMTKERNRLRDKQVEESTRKLEKLYKRLDDTRPRLTEDQRYDEEITLTNLLHSKFQRQKNALDGYLHESHARWHAEERMNVAREGREERRG